MVELTKRNRPPFLPGRYFVYGEKIGSLNLVEMMCRPGDGLCVLWRYAGSATINTIHTRPSCHADFGDGWSHWNAVDDEIELAASEIDALPPMS